MANDGAASKPRNLEEFQADFGKLSERLENAAHPNLEREPLPAAEQNNRATPQPDKDKSAEYTASIDAPFLPDKQVKKTFNNAHDNTRTSTPPQKDRAGVGSKMVEKDASRLNATPPPEMAKAQDNISHKKRMRFDDRAARLAQANKAAYERLSANGALDKYKDVGQDKEQIRQQDNGRSR